MSTQPIDVYAPLPYRSKRISQSTTTAVFSSTAPFTPSYVISSLSQSSDPTGIYNTRVKGRQMLLENPARDSRLKKDTARKTELRKKEKEKRKLGIAGKQPRGLCQFDQKSIKWSSLLPLHHLWMGYMSELLNLPPPPANGFISASSIAKLAPSSSSMHPKLLKADFHGAVLTVKNAKNPCLVGFSGILIHETENAFKVVTEKDTVKLIPKHNSIFTFSVPVFSTLPATFKPGMAYTLHSDPPVAEASSIPTNGLTPTGGQTALAVPNLTFELYGNQFMFRSAERAGRKFKHKETIEL